MRASGRTILSNKKKPAAGFCFKWLGCRDSNPGMLVSETRALPLGDTPIALNRLLNDFEIGWGTRIRTSECRNQNPVPYRLAIPQQFLLPKQIDNLNLVATTGFEPVTPSL